MGWERKGRCAGWGLTRTAKGLSAELNLVGALKVLDEGVGTEGGVLASGTAEVGGFAASEGGEGLLPTSGRWPALLELVDVQPARGLDAAEMSGGGGPRVGTGGAGHVIADDVQLNVTESGLPMGMSWTQE